MPSRPLPPEKQADVDQLAREIREAVDAEISELAAHLATTDDAHLFGDNEFTIRARAHKIAAKAVERHRAHQPTAPKAPGRPARTAAQPPRSTRTAGTPRSVSWGPSATAALPPSAAGAVRACSLSTATRA
jgi:hypothetical protein